MVKAPKLGLAIALTIALGGLSLIPFARGQAVSPPTVAQPQPPAPAAAPAPEAVPAAPPEREDDTGVMLEDIQRRLDELLLGRAEDARDLDSLFNVRLTDAPALARYAEALREDIQRAAGARRGLTERLGSLERDFPPPPVPEIVANPPAEPTPPVPPAGQAPTAPAPPQAPAPEPPGVPEPTDPLRSPSVTAPLASSAPPLVEGAPAVAAPPVGGAGAAAPATPTAAPAALAPAEAPSLAAGAPGLDEGARAAGPVPEAQAEVSQAERLEVSASDVADVALEGAGVSPPPPPAAGKQAERVAYEAALLRYEDERRGYEEAQAAWEAAQEAYVKDLAQHEQALVAWGVDMLRVEEARALHEQAMAAYVVEREARRAALQEEMTRGAREASVASARLRYVEQLLALISALPAPAALGLQDLGRPLVALRDTAEQAAVLGRALLEAAERVERLGDRAATGGLLGFLSARQELERSARSIAAAYRERAAIAATTAKDLLRKAEHLESSGSAVRGAILASAAAPDRALRLDGLFLKHLQALRSLRKSLGSTATVGADGLALPKALGRLRMVVDEAQAIGTVSQGEQALDLALTVLENQGAQVRALQATVGLWDLAFERLNVAVLEGMATEEVRANAYSFSAETLTELGLEFKAVGLRFLAWGAELAEGVLSPMTWLRTATGIAQLMRILLALATLVALIVVRKRFSGGVVWAVRRLAGWHRLQIQVGVLVRLAGLFEAALPPLLRLAGAYAILYLIGLDRPETQIAEVVVRWVLGYHVGRELLRGLTRPAGRGRPAPITVRSEVAELLAFTYARGGLVLAIAGVADEISRRWLGLGILHNLIALIETLWLVGVWGIWATLAWRPVLSGSWRRRLSQGSRLIPLTEWMARSRWGALLVPFVVVYIVGRALTLVLRSVLDKKGFFTYLRARALRRKSRRDTAVVVDRSDQLPEEYTREFPLFPLVGETDALVLPRGEQLQALQAQFARWLEAGTESSVVIIGEKGTGKTTLLGLFAGDTKGIPVVSHTFKRKVVSEVQLVAELSPVLGAEDVTSVTELEAFIKAGPRRVLLLDEAHNTFLRVVDGYAGFDAMVRLVNATREHIFWALVCNDFAWHFINETRRRVRYFRRLLFLPPWSVAEIQELITSRNRRSGYAVDFDEVILDARTSEASALELVEGSESFFRLLWESSRGNPRIATWRWLHSLTPTGERHVRAGLLGERGAEALEDLGPELLFALAAICQHENLSAEELSLAQNVPLEFARFAVQYLEEYGFIEPKPQAPERYTLTPRFYGRVLDTLTKKHLVFERR